MKNKMISDVLGKIDDKYIAESAAFAADPAVAVAAVKRSYRIKIAVLAACIAVLGGVIFAACAVAAEQKEYNDAVEFFNANDLPTEGLSRAEIKAVYYDITTNSFTNEKTAEVLKKAVSGWEISQSEPTPAAAASVRARTYKPPLFVGNLDLSDFRIIGYVSTENGAMAWGRSDDQKGHILSIDRDGNEKWRKSLEHGFEDCETVSAIVDNGDGTWAVFSLGDRQYLCLSCFDANGEELYFKKTFIGSRPIVNAARLGDGYLVQLDEIRKNGYALTTDNMYFIKIDRDCNITAKLSFDESVSEYHLTDMFEYYGKVYLSAYLIPKNSYGDMVEESFDLQTSDKVTAMMRKKYTAVLFVCDNESITPTTFYSVSGSLGGKLSVNEQGLLEWEAESITAVMFSPNTNAFTFIGYSRVLRYTFDENGALRGQIDTGELINFIF